MSKIHPADQKRLCGDKDVVVVLSKKEDDHHHHQERIRSGGPSVLTVWKRSSMSFQGTDGFTVFDTNGRLVFRVDNYSRKNRYVGAGLVLMDGVGNALLTFKPQMLSMQYQWNAYREEGHGNNSKMKVFSMRSTSVLFHTGKDVAEIFMEGHTRQGQIPDFRIEGSFRARDCKIKTPSGEVVAKMARKRVNTTILLSDDVFSLVVQPGFDTQLIMAFVIILDRISNKPFTPVLCS